MIYGLVFRARRPGGDGASRTQNLAAIYILKNLLPEQQIGFYLVSLNLADLAGLSLVLVVSTRGCRLALLPVYL